MKEQGYAVDRSAQVLLNAPVKTLGSFKTAIRLHPEVKVDIDFTVARSLEEAKHSVAQAAALLERAEDAAKLEAEAAVQEAPEEAAAEPQA